MREILDEYKDLTREELYDAIVMLAETVQPSIYPALESYLDQLKSEKVSEERDPGETEIDEQILAVEANVINLSYDPYVDDQLEIGLIGSALDRLKALLMEHHATLEQVRRFEHLKDQYYEVFCDCGYENDAGEICELMKKQA